MRAINEAQVSALNLKRDALLAQLHVCGCSASTHFYDRVVADAMHELVVDGMIKAIATRCALFRA
jgi:hypothetical protein